jgi:hypothetical protein
MSAIVSNLTSPVMYSGGDPARNAPSPAVGDLAQSTKSTANNARVIPAQQVGDIQQTSRHPRTTPPQLAESTTQESKAGHFTPKEDQIAITENFRIARNPQQVETGGPVGGLNVESGLNTESGLGPESKLDIMA